MSRRLPLLLIALILLCIAVLLIHAHYKRRDGNSAKLVIDISSSPVGFPSTLAADHDGNIYFNEERQNRVIKISTDRHVEVVAGNGQIGFSGDGGPAIQASLASPTSIAFDSAGNLFIADTGNNRIRRVDAQSQIITSLPGDNFKGQWVGEIAKYTDASPGAFPLISIAVDPDANIYVGVPHAGGIRRIESIDQRPTQILGGGLLGDPSDPVPMLGPFWMTVDTRGNLFFSDPNRNVISQVNPLRKDVHRIAGSPVCGFAGDGGPAEGALLCFPQALAASNNKLFISDTGNSRIRQVDLTTSTIKTVAGDGQAGYTGDGGLAVNARLNGPAGIAVDSKGNLYIADSGNNCVRRVDASTGVITSWWRGEIGNRLEHTDDRLSATLPTVVFRKLDAADRGASR